jgi:hypothetical protein
MGMVVMKKTPNRLWLLASCARIGSSPGQEVAQEQATTLGKIPYGWIRIKLL